MKIERSLLVDGKHFHCENIQLNNVVILLLAFGFGPNDFFFLVS